MMDVKLASYYCGLSPTTFLARVQAGALPQGRRDGKRALWDMAVLNRALDRLSGIVSTSVKAESSVAPEEEAAVAIMLARIGKRPRVAERISTARRHGEAAREISTQQKASVDSAWSEVRTPITPEALKEWAAAIHERLAKNAIVDKDPVTIERIIAAHRAGDPSGKIAAR